MGDHPLPCLLGAARGMVYTIVTTVLTGSHRRCVRAPHTSGCVGYFFEHSVSLSLQMHRDTETKHFNYKLWNCLSLLIVKRFRVNLAPIILFTV